MAYSLWNLTQANVIEYVKRYSNLEEKSGIFFKKVDLIREFKKFPIEKSGLENVDQKVN